MIFMSVAKEMPSFLMKLTLLGEEKTRWEEQHGKHRHTYIGYHEIVERTVLLFRTGSFIVPGYYQFPFEYELPEALPPTFALNIVARGSIEYWLEASLHIERNGEMKRVGLARCPVLILQNLPKEIKYNVSFDLAKRVVTCCCMGRGSVTILARFSKDCFTVGEKAQVDFKIDTLAANNDIKSIDLMLVRHVVFRANGGRRYVRRISLMTIRMPGIKRGQFM